MSVYISFTLFMSWLHDPLLALADLAKTNEIYITFGQEFDS